MTYDPVQHLKAEKRINQVIRPFATIAWFAVGGPVAAAIWVGASMLSEHCSNELIKEQGAEID